MADENGSRSLASLQHWFQAVITDPHGVEAGISGAPASSAIDLQPGELERVILPSLRVSSLERISIYANAYFARLTECLREEFPALLHALDEETFAAFAVGYLEAVPPSSYTLANLGARFAEFLAAAVPHDEEPTPEADWGLFLVELARLERLYSEVFDGLGDEGEPGLTIEKLQGVPQDRWEEMTFVPLKQSAPRRAGVSGARIRLGRAQESRPAVARTSDDLVGRVASAVHRQTSGHRPAGVSDAARAQSERDASRCPQRPVALVGRRRTFGAGAIRLVFRLDDQRTFP